MIVFSSLPEKHSNPPLTFLSRASCGLSLYWAFSLLPFRGYFALQPLSFFFANPSLTVNKQLQLYKISNFDQQRVYHSQIKYLSSHSETFFHNFFFFQILSPYFFTLRTFSQNSIKINKI